MQLVDPVTGNDSTSLLRGPAVTSTLVDLENQNRGTIVTGVAADGATQVVIRIAGAPPGETFSLSLDQDGALAERGSTDFQSSIPALQADPSGKAVVLYRAPDDFAQVGTIASVTAPSRTVHLNFTSTDNPGVTGDTPITVLRPPVLLIHGFWGHPGNWDPFVSNLSWDYLTYDKPFSALPTITATQPALASQATLNQQLLQSVQTKGDSSALGVLFNAGFVLPQISTLLQQFKNANGVAAVQADVVAHSMGGLVTRAFPQLQGYYADSNFAQGFVHKLISIDTPHLGTPIANQFLSTGAPIGDNTCMRQYQAAKGKLAASTVTMAGYGSVNAAVGDMTGDGFGGGLSPEVAALQGGTANIPTAFIAGNGCGFVNCPFGPISGVLQSYLLLRCSSAPLAQALESFTWPLIFHQDSDAIVPLTSQSNNGRSGSTAAYVFQDVHSPGAKLLLGFTSTSDVLSDTRTAAAVIQLLNKPRCSAGGCQSGAATPFTKLLAA
jgi:pimeloyl-ACP methyl ester carboxylesterase